MKTTWIPITKLLPTLKVDKGRDFTVPYGEYDKNDPEDMRLLSMVPARLKQYRYPPALLLKVLAGIHFRGSALIYGPTGTGKSLFWMMLASLLNMPFTRFQCDGDLGHPEMVGYLGVPIKGLMRKVKKSDGTVEEIPDDGYKFPLLVRAIQHPGIVILDEWDSCQAEGAACLQTLCENVRPGLQLIEIAEFINKDENCFIGATANSRGMGDPEGLYASVQMQNYAQLCRFTQLLELPALEQKSVIKVLQSMRVDGKKLESDRIKAFADLYEMARAANLTTDLSVPLNLRMLQQLAEISALLGADALESVILNKMPMEKDMAALHGMAVQLDLVKDN